MYMTINLVEEFSMNKEAQVFFAGLCDGIQEVEGVQKTAAVFTAGLRDGVEAATHVPIMSKIAHFFGEDEDTYEDEMSGSTIIQRLIHG